MFINEGDNNQTPGEQQYLVPIEQLRQPQLQQQQQSRASDLAIRQQQQQSQQQQL